MDQIILVDKEDNFLGFESKEKCHAGDGILHRAFSVFIFNGKGELLVQQRSKEKRLWPLFWSNTCCSHPRANEDYEAAAKRRLREEMGFSCELEWLYRFQYQARYKDIGSENELCSVLVGTYSGKVRPNPEEVADYKWIPLDELQKDIRENPEKYTPWFKMEVKELFSEKEICGI